MLRFAYGTLTPCGPAFQTVPLAAHAPTRRSYNPARASLHRRFGLFPGRSPLLGESLVYFLFLKVLRCFSSLGSPHCNDAVIAALQAAGLSHSEIPGSRVICTLPGLIAAYHVLHRLREPRHPPDALTCFRLMAAIRAEARCRLLILSAVFEIFIYSVATLQRKSLYLQSCVSECQRSLHRTAGMRRNDGAGGEYRGRTDDLLHAMQAL